MLLFALINVHSDQQTIAAEPALDFWLKNKTQGQEQGLANQAEHCDFNSCPTGPHLAQLCAAMLTQSSTLFEPPTTSSIYWSSGPSGWHQPQRAAPIFIIQPKFLIKKSPKMIRLTAHSAQQKSKTAHRQQELDI